MRWDGPDCRNALRKRYIWLGIAAAVLALSGRSEAAGFASGGVLARTVAWSYASFQAERLGGKVTADLRIATLPAAAEQAAFLPSPRGEPFRVSGPDVLKLSIHIRIDIIGRGPVTVGNHIWFDPLDGTPLFLVRTRLGLDDYYQQFRFTQEGVFRRQREPASAAEAARPPESWTKRGEHFYAYPPDETNCHPVLETSMLIYLLSAATATETRETGPLCVFHKRQLHRVSLQAAPVQAVPFDFLEKKGGGEIRRTGTEPARRIQLKSRPIGSYRGQVEDFFRDGTLLVLSLDGSLPLMASCELPLIGGVEMKLKEIHFN
jgi:hypothetical protein